MIDLAFLVAGLVLVGFVIWAVSSVSYRDGYAKGYEDGYCDRANNIHPDKRKKEK